MEKNDPNWQYLARSDKQFSIVWAAQNPDLFKERYQDFFDMFREPEFTLSSYARSGFLTLIAERKQK